MASYTGSDKRLQYLFEHGGGGGADIWTGTQAEYTQQASQIEDGTLVNITDDEGIAQAWHVFSTAERIVGQWVDGSDIYEKTISIGNLPNNTTKAVAHGVSNMSILLDIRGTCNAVQAGTLYSRPLPMSDPSTSNNIRVDLVGANINIKTAADWSAYSGYVTIQYTKSS